MIMSDFLY